MTVIAITLLVLCAPVLAVWLSRHVLISLERKRGFLLTEDFRPTQRGGSPRGGSPEPPRTADSVAQASNLCESVAQVSNLCMSPANAAKGQVENLSHLTAKAQVENLCRQTDGLPFVSVVVAAKDEEGCIERCVRTMLEQDYPDFELLVANDRSTDRTGQIVERLAAGDKRLRLVNITHLPEGWCGKNNAMQTAIAASKGEWICMIDADCRQTSRATLRLAMQYAIQEEADLLSVLPNLEMIGFWENVVQPVCGGIMMIWFNPDKVNSTRFPHAYANGAFMLIRRRAYQAVGTHAAVRSEVNEDMHLAARLKAAGLRLKVVRNRGLYLVRMYTSLAQIVRGWGRIFYGTFGTRKRLTVSLALLVTMGLLPYLAALVGFVGAAGGLGPGNLLLSVGLVGLSAALMQLSVIYRFYRLIGARPGLAWTYPLGCCVGIAALCVSLSKLRKGAQVTWRNTTYTKRS